MSGLYFCVCYFAAPKKLKHDIYIYKIKTETYMSNLKYFFTHAQLCIKLIWISQNLTYKIGSEYFQFLLRNQKPVLETGNMIILTENVIISLTSIFQIKKTFFYEILFIITKECKTCFRNTNCNNISYFYTCDKKLLFQNVSHFYHRIQNQFQNQEMG